jgi:hypothetical protein
MKTIEEITKKYTALKCANPYLQAVTDEIHELIKEITQRSNGNSSLVTDREPLDDKATVNAFYMIYRLEDILDTITEQDDRYISKKKESLKRIEAPKLKDIKPVHIPEIEPLEPLEFEFDDSVFDDGKKILDEAGKIFDEDSFWENTLASITEEAVSE